MLSGTPSRHTQRPATITPVKVSGCTPATRCPARFAGQRRRRHVIAHHQVGGGPGHQRPERRAEDLRREILSALQQRGRGVRAPRPEALPLPEVREPELGQHVGRPPVGAQRRSFTERLDGRMPNRVVHVRPRIVDEPGARCRHACDVALRQVHAVRQHRAVVQQAVPLQAVHDAGPMRAPGPLFVVRGFGDVNVDAGPMVARQVTEGGKARLAEGKRGVGADQPPELRVGARRGEEAVVLGQPRVPPPHPATVRHFITKHATDTDHAEGLADDVERAGNGVG